MMKTSKPCKSSTICAAATPAGGAIGVVRLSGSDAVNIAASVFSRPDSVRDRYMAHGFITDGERIVDEVMLCAFCAPASYTGENMTEIYCHGSRETMRGIIELLTKRGARAAEPGEFTKRAFLNGKLALSQAEAVMDVINASAQRSAQSALLQLTGSLARRVDAAESALVDALSLIDACIDYPDEMEDEGEQAIAAKIDAAVREFEALMLHAKGAAHIREGVRVAIVGRPNAGKSTLLNTLLGRDRAIVTAKAGTTRDVLTETVAIDGVPFALTDTAGLRETDDEAEAVGVLRARQAMDAADVLMLTFDGECALSDEDAAMLRETEGRARVAVVTKLDAGARIDTGALLAYHIDTVFVSAHTGEGIDELKALLVDKSGIPEGGSEILTNARHIEAIGRALACAESAAGSNELDAKATDVREALHCIGAVTGHETDARVIDEIFRRFCVGK